MRDIIYLVTNEGVEHMDIALCTTDSNKFKQYLNFGLTYHIAPNIHENLGYYVIVDGYKKYRLFYSEYDNSLILQDYHRTAYDDIINEYGALKEKTRIPLDDFIDFDSFSKWYTEQPDYDDECDCLERSAEYNCCLSDVRHRGLFVRSNLSDLREWIQFINLDK